MDNFASSAAQGLAAAQDSLPGRVVRDAGISCDSKPCRAVPGNPPSAHPGLKTNKAGAPVNRSPQANDCSGFILPWSFPLLHLSFDFPLPLPFPALSSLGNENPFPHSYFSLHCSPSPLSACAPASSPHCPLSSFHLNLSLALSLP